MDKIEPLKEQITSEQSQELGESSTRTASFKERLMGFVFGEEAGRRPPKRIVSKSEYIALVSKREVNRWSGVVLAITVATFIISAVVLIIGGLATDGFGWKVLDIVLGVLLLAIAWVTKNLAEKIMQKASVALDVVPLTRANRGDLTIAESLVRASQEPVQPQQTELLRAAPQGARETPAEELLRATLTRGQD